jgi:hypothetical protein
MASAEKGKEKGKANFDPALKHLSENIILILCSHQDIPESQLIQINCKKDGFAQWPLHATFFISKKKTPYR